MRLHCIAFTVAVLALLAGVPAASAEMEIGMQDDLTIVDGNASRDLALDQFIAMGGTHVRMTIDHKRGGKSDDLTTLGASRRPVALYDDAVAAILDRGLTPQFTLFWRGQTDPRLWKKWANTVARHFAGKVDRFSVGNEPDLYEIEATPCTKATMRSMAEQFPDEINGRRAKVLTEGRSVPLHDACLRYQRGITYRKIFGPAAAGLRAANPDVEVLAGETSALRGLDWFFKGAKVRTLDADGYAHHPFQYRDLTPNKSANGWGIGNLDMLKRAVRMPIYLTEFGYPHPNSSMDKRVFGRRLTEKEVAKALPTAWRVARHKGAKQMLQYQWFQKPSFRTEYWDTALLNDDDGQTTPAYDALKNLINSW
jgi:hypothetical protein